MGYLYLFLASFLWGTSFIAGKYAFDLADPALIVMFRFIMASFIWIGILIAKKQFVSIKQFKSLAPIAILMIPCTFLLQFIGLKYTSAASAATIIGVEPLLIITVAYLLWQEKPKIMDVLLGFMALAGVYLVIGSFAGAELFGSALIFISTIVVAVWVNWSKILMKDMTATHFTAATTIIGTLFLIPISLFLSKNLDLNFNISSQSIYALIYLGFGCSLMAGWLWNKGISLTQTNTGGLFLALEPVFGVLLAIILLNDKFNLLQMVGVVIVLLSVLLGPIIAMLRKNI